MSTSTKARSACPSVSVISMNASGAMARSLRVAGGERLAGVGLTVEAGEPRAVRQRRFQDHPDLGEAGGVGEEERVGLAALASAWRWATAGRRLALPGRPEVVRRRAAFAVRAGAAEEALAGESGTAVPEGADRRPGADRGELGLGHHPVAGASERMRRSKWRRGRLPCGASADRPPRPAHRPAQSGRRSVGGLPPAVPRPAEKRCLASAEAGAGTEGGAVRAMWRENEDGDRSVVTSTATGGLESRARG